jgi:hypothetical protein
MVARQFVCLRAIGSRIFLQIDQIAYGFNGKTKIASMSDKP